MENTKFSTQFDTLSIASLRGGALESHFSLSKRLEVEFMWASSKLRALIEGDGIVVAPGCYDGLSARLVEAAGFPAVYVTGGGMARSTGIPDTRG